MTPRLVKGGGAHKRLARYSARCPVASERLGYDAATGTVTYTSDKLDEPTAGRHTVEATAFIAQLVAHIPDQRQVLQRCCGYYANRMRGERDKGRDEHAGPWATGPLAGDAAAGAA